MGCDFELLVMSASELAQKLGVSVRHIRRLDAAGKLPQPVKIGRCVRWRVGDIMEWLQSGTPDRAKWNARKGGEDKL